MRKLHWHPSAIEDLQQIIDYCRITFGSRIAKEVRDRLRHDVTLLKTQPYLGYPHPGYSSSELELRSLAVKHTNILYSIHQEYIYIHILWSTRRDPEALRRELTDRVE